MIKIPLISALILCFTVTNPSQPAAQSRPVWLKREFPHIVAGDTMWIGTPKGLYQYHAGEDTWAVYGESHGLPSNDIRILLWDGEFLWAATPEGLAYGDIKLNKWIAF